MTRKLGIFAAALTALGVLVLVGPAQLHPGACRQASDAASEIDAIRAFYASCWDRPTVGQDGVPREPAFGLRTDDDTYYPVVHPTLVRYSDDRRRVILVAQREGDGAWRVVGDERVP